MTKNQVRILAWLNGAAVAVTSGIATAASAWFIAPDTFNLQGGLDRMLQLLGISASYHLITYMRQSPLPRLEWDESVTTTTVTTPSSTTTTTETK